MRINIRACAKINWSLCVRGEREDGYHELDMLMQRVELCDELSFERARRLTLEVDGQRLPGGDRNLVIRAANALNEALGKRMGARITLKKRIPARAGLGGGSADCAAALIALNKLWNLRLPMRTLSQLGLRLGADVPFCLRGGLCRAQGVGELLTPMPESPALWLVMLTPGGGLSTPAVFRAWSAERERQLAELERAPQIGGDRAWSAEREHRPAEPERAIQNGAFHAWSEERERQPAELERAPQIGGYRAWSAERERRPAEPERALQNGAFHAWSEEREHRPAEPERASQNGAFRTWSAERERRPAEPEHAPQNGAFRTWSAERERRPAEPEHAPQNGAFRAWSAEREHRPAESERAPQNGAFRAWSAERERPPIDAEALARALGAGDLSLAQAISRNDLEAPAISLMPEIGAWMERLRSLGAPFVRMSGSGSTVFAAFPDEAAARSAAAQIPGAILTRTRSEEAPPTNNPPTPSNP